MKLQNTNSVNFGKVYALYGTKQQISNNLNRICSDLGRKNPDIEILNATDIYKTNNGSGILTKAASEGKDVFFIVAGKGDCDNLKFKSHGWGSINGVSQHINKGFNLDKIKEKDIEEIKKSALNLDKTI